MANLAGKLRLINGAAQMGFSGSAPR